MISFLNFIHYFFLVSFHRGLFIFHFKALSFLEVLDSSLSINTLMSDFFISLNSKASFPNAPCFFYFPCNLFPGSLMTLLSVRVISKSSMILSLNFQLHNFTISWWTQCLCLMCTLNPKYLMMNMTVSFPWWPLFLCPFILLKLKVSQN